MKNYTPPYTITNEMLSLVSEITEYLGQLGVKNDLSKLPKLRRVNRLRSIHSSLAIEHNSLSIDQVSDILNGKRVIGPPDEIQEVKNAIDAYRLLETVDPISVDDLLRVHAAMTQGLVDDPGSFRSGEEGVFAGDRCIHLAPPAKFVPDLVGDLFNWLATSDAHPLIKSSVFHYEFEFIHPFTDGNGRIGRLWQTSILMRWRPIFAWIPVESIIHERQEEYYRAISDSTSDGSSNAFITFMLNAILDSIIDIAVKSSDHVNNLSPQVRRLVGVMQDHPMSALELMELLGLRSRVSFSKNYLKPALEAGLIEMTEPDKPTSRNQMYIRKR